MGGSQPAFQLRQIHGLVQLLRQHGGKCYVMARLYKSPGKRKNHLQFTSRYTPLDGSELPLSLASGRASELVGFPTGCTLISSDKYTTNFAADEIRITKMILKPFRTSSSIHFGHFLDESKTEVVLKIASLDDILREADCYHQLKDVHGDAVPNFYGMLYDKEADDKYGEEYDDDDDEEDEGEDEEGDAEEDDDRENIGCLVLERFREALEGTFDTLGKQEKALILDTLAKIHRAGVHLVDFAEYNVLQNDDDFRIIDFGPFGGHPSPGCTWSYDFLTATVDLLKAEGLASTRASCSILFEVAMEEMRICDDVVYINDREFSAHNLPSQRVLNSWDLQPKMSCHWERAERVPLLFRYYRLLYEMRKAPGSIIGTWREKQI